MVRAGKLYAVRRQVGAYLKAAAGSENDEAEKIFGAVLGVLLRIKRRDLPNGAFYGGNTLKVLSRPGKAFEKRCGGKLFTKSFPPYCF